MFRSFFFIFITLLLPFMAHSQQESSAEELRVIFQKQKNPALVRGDAQKVGQFLSRELGRLVTTKVPGSYAAAVQALISKKADIAYVDSLAYLLAKRDGEAQVLLAEERMDAQGVLRTEYDSIFVVRKDSPLKTFQDLLNQVSETSLVFTSPTSTSGFVMAYKRFVQEGVLKAGQNAKEVFKEVHYGGSYAQALEEVLQKRGDVAAVSYYTMEGDSANSYLPEEKRAQLRILERTPGVPTHLVVARAGLEPNLREKITAAILKLTKEQPQLLTDVYGTSRFVKVDGDQHVATAREAMGALKLPLFDLVHKKITPEKISEKYAALAVK